MKNITRCIAGARTNEIKNLVDLRMKEFKQIGRGSSKDIFKELCFCLLTANFQAEKSIVIQKSIGDGFLTLSEKQLAGRLRRLGYRFPNVRAKYIVEARRHVKGLKRKIKSFEDPAALREWVVDSFKGLGYKEASHFLRNIGFSDYAIVDFHIVDFLERFGVVEKPKTMTSKKYIEIEGVLKGLGCNCGMNMAELDLYMWYCETGKILK